MASDFLKNTLHCLTGDLTGDQTVIALVWVTVKALTLFGAIIHVITACLLEWSLKLFKSCRLPVGSAFDLLPSHDFMM